MGLIYRQTDRRREVDRIWHMEEEGTEGRQARESNGGRSFRQVREGWRGKQTEREIQKRSKGLRGRQCESDRERGG